MIDFSDLDTCIFLCSKCKQIISFRKADDVAKCPSIILVVADIRDFVHEMRMLQFLQRKVTSYYMAIA